MRWSRSTRDSRRWAELEKIVGPGVRQLSISFRHGLYHLRSRSSLADSELVLAYQRCRAWLARTKNGIGECECGCQTKMAVDAKNAKKQSVWCLDHDPLTKTFRGVIHERCNREIGDGTRKWVHAAYVDAHEARLQQDVPVVPWQTEFPPPSVVD